METGFLPKTRFPIKRAPSALQFCCRAGKPVLTRFTAGNGRVEATAEGWRLHLPSSSGYSDAQLDDTQGRVRHRLLHRPPLQLSLEARASGATPLGTLGFGFLNDPFPSIGGP